MSEIDAIRHDMPGRLPEPLLCSKAESARLLSVCVRTIGNLIAAKELPVRRCGRRCLIPYKALVKYAQKAR
jgi:excisionase family DNA binding protein